MDPIGLIYIVLGLAVLGFVVWLITTYIPMPDIFKKVIYVIVAIVLLLWILSYVGYGFPAHHLYRP